MKVINLDKYKAIFINVHLCLVLFNCFMTEVHIIETSPFICCANQWTAFYMIALNDFVRDKITVPLNIC